MCKEVVSLGDLVNGQASIISAFSSRLYEAQSLRSSLTGPVFMCFSCLVFLTESLRVSVSCQGKDEGTRTQLCKGFLLGSTFGGFCRPPRRYSPRSSPFTWSSPPRTRTTGNSKFLFVSSWEPFLRFLGNFWTVRRKIPECYLFRFFRNFLAPNLCCWDFAPWA